MTVFLKPPDHADVRQPASAPTAEHKGDRPITHSFILFGHLSGCVLQLNLAFAASAGTADISGMFKKSACWKVGLGYS